MNASGAGRKHAPAVKTLSNICKKNILNCLERKRFALQPLTAFFKSLLPYKLILKELLLEFYSVNNLSSSKHVKVDRQYEVLLRLEEENPEFMLHSNQIWHNFVQTIDEFYSEKYVSRNADGQLMELLLHNKKLNGISLSLNEELRTAFEKTTSYKAIYLQTLRNIDSKKNKATANIIKLQNDLQLERDSKSIVILDHLDAGVKKTQGKKVSRSKLFQKALNEHRIDSKKFLPAECNSKTSKRKIEHNSSKPKIKRVKL